MKRFLFALLFLLFAVSTQAQTLVFEDSFEQASGTELADLTPTTGTSWTLLDNDFRTLRLNTGGDYVEPSGFSNGQGMAYSADYTVGSADVDVEIEALALTTDVDDGMWAFARYADANNFYAVEITRNGTTKAELWKVVSGSSTSLGTSSSTPANGDIIKLELRGSDIKVYFDTGSGYGSAEISASDSSITAQGKSGLGCGDIFNQFSGDDIGACSIGFLKVTEVSAGGGSFLPPMSVF